MSIGLSHRVWQFLRDNACGRDNVKGYRVIALALLPDMPEKLAWRRVARAIETLRLEGKPVCTSRKKGQAGAFIPATREEAANSLRAPYAALFHQKRALDKLSHSIELMFDHDLVREIQEEFEELEVKQAG
jgi:tRNA A37 N6-isopentenylltransferase MiaA